MWPVPESMTKRSSTLAIIPARGGSKRLPGKNLMPLQGKPLISWTIEAATQTGIFGTICVSTDSEQIRTVALAAGASVPFARPLELSSDNATSVDVVVHALEFYSKRGTQFETFCLLQPTSPLRSAEDIAGAYELYSRAHAESVTAVTEVDHSPLWANTLGPDRSMVGFLRAEVVGLRSQELPTYYRVNGAIYFCRAVEFMSRRTFISASGSFAYIMPRERSIDIDTELDFEVAQALLRRKP